MKKRTTSLICIGIVLMAAIIITIIFVASKIQEEHAVDSQDIYLAISNRFVFPIYTTKKDSSAGQGEIICLSDDKYRNYVKFNTEPAQHGGETPHIENVQLSELIELTEKNGTNHAKVAVEVVIDIFEDSVQIAWLTFDYTGSGESLLISNIAIEITPPNSVNWSILTSKQADVEIISQKVAEQALMILAKRLNLNPKDCTLIEDAPVYDGNGHFFEDKPHFVGYYFNTVAFGERQESNFYLDFAYVDDGSEYVFHQYEVVTSYDDQGKAIECHTATSNWYSVNLDTKEIRNFFDELI